MRSSILYRRGAKTRRGPGREDRPGRTFYRFRAVAEAAVLVLLLLAVVASALAGSGAMVLYVTVGAWLVLLVIVGIRNVLDAGCAFMLLAVGVVVVVDLAYNGPGPLLP